MGIQTSLLASPERCRTLADTLRQQFAAGVPMETPPLSWTANLHVWFAWPADDGRHLCITVHRLSRRTRARWVEPSRETAHEWNELSALHELALDEQELDPSLTGAFWIAREAARSDVARLHGPGAHELFWARKRDVLYEGFGIEWRSPGDLNPLVLFGE